MTGSSSDEHRLATLARRAIEALRRIDGARSLSANQEDVVDAAVAVESIARALRGSKSGREVILELLKAASPAEVSTDFLRHASGIQEFARRIRELRVEAGYDIIATSSGYCLLNPEPDADVARKWLLMNEIRRQSVSGFDRIRMLFDARIGEIVTTPEIEYVSRISSGPRRVRELRTEHGLRIESHKDNPNLRPGQYVLVDPNPIPAMERAVGVRQREGILERDGHRCVNCHREPNRAQRLWLEVDHIVPVARGGSNDDDNLRTLCNECHRTRRSSE